jgi:hypothetical protein
MKLWTAADSRPLCLTSHKLKMGFWKENYLLTLNFSDIRELLLIGITALWQKEKNGEGLRIFKKTLDGTGQWTRLNWQMEVGCFEL